MEDRWEFCSYFNLAITRSKACLKVEVSMVFWLRVEMISGNGHPYIRVPINNDAEVVVERVSSKATRPYPPPVAMDDHWVHGILSKCSTILLGKRRC
ncbi:hypothetical protein OIU76_006820 [Salix suchowensis]|nr:hypothetical protein OIU76_006820 [Salix suchowensis]